MPVILQTTVIFTHYSMALSLFSSMPTLISSIGVLKSGSVIEIVLMLNCFFSLTTGNTHSLNYIKKSLSSGTSRKTCCLSTTNVTMATRMTHSLSHTEVLHTGRCLESFLLSTSSPVQSKIFSSFSYTQL